MDITRSISGIINVAESELSPGSLSDAPAGTVSVAVLTTMVPANPDSTVAVTVYTTELPAGKSSTSAISPIPIMVLPVAPPVAIEV